MVATGHWVLNVSHAAFVIPPGASEVTVLYSNGTAVQRFIGKHKKEQRCDRHGFRLSVIVISFFSPFFFSEGEPMLTVKE